MNPIIDERLRNVVRDFALVEGISYEVAARRIGDLLLRPDQPAQTIALIAGNARQANDYRRERGYSVREALYVSNPTVVRDRRVHRIEWVGTYYDRPDLAEIEDAAFAAKILTEGTALDGSAGPEA